MAEIGLPQPKERIGIRGNPESTPVLKSTEKLGGPGSSPNFGGAFNTLAATPTVLGEISSKVAVGATNSLMDRWGYQMGSNPHGNLLPAFTKADERFNQAYSNQAQATLGLEANKLLMDGQLQLQSAYKLSPGMISSYTKNMVSGLKDILSNAPDSIKGKLANQYTDTLMRSENNLKSKMITQQKDEYKAQQNAYTQTQIQNIYESAMSGDEKGSKGLYESVVSRNKQLKDSGIISPSQELTNNQAAKQTFLTGIYSQKAMAARQEGRLEPYLSGLNEKPDGISYLDWQTTVKSVLANVSQFEALAKRDHSLIEAEFNLAVLEGKVTADTLAELDAKLSPEEAARAKIGFLNHRNKESKGQQATSDLAANWGDTVSQADATTKVRNETFKSLTKAYQQKSLNEGKGEISDIEAKTAVANLAGAPVPVFTDELNAMAMSANPDLMIQASGVLKVLGDLKAPMSTKAKAMLFGFQSQLSQGLSPLEAAQIVKENIAPKNLAELESQENQWSQFHKENLQTFDDQKKFAKSLMGIPWWTNNTNMDAIVTQVNKGFESNYRLLNGDVNAAKALTAHNLEQSYGVTYANGYREYTYLPIEKFMDVEGDATGIIQNEAANQVDEQLRATKEAYDKGHNDFYYQVAERPRLEESLAAKKEIEKIQSKVSVENLTFQSAAKRNNELLRLQKIADHYTSNEPVTIEKVWRGKGGVEKFQMVIQASNNMGLGINSTTPIAGGYDVSIRTVNGKLTPIIGIDNASNGNIVFKPNIKKLQQDYYAIHGFAEPETAQERLKLIAVLAGKYKEQELPKTKETVYKGAFDALRNR